MSVVSADKIINQSMYAKGVVNVFQYPSSGQALRKVASGGYIGRVYSYVIREDGKLFWMFIDSARFPDGTFYVEHDSNKLSVPNMNNILAEIKAEQEAQKRDEKGVLQYNIDKYVPYIIGIFAAVMLLPLFNKNRSNNG